MGLFEYRFIVDVQEKRALLLNLHIPWLQLAQVLHEQTRQKGGLYCVEMNHESCRMMNALYLKLPRVERRNNACG